MTCSIAECDRAKFSRGWCRLHYQRWYKHGDPHHQPRSATKAAAWTAADDAFMVANPGLSHAATAQAIGRTIEAVRQRRYKLRLRGVRVGELEANQMKPWHVGERRLLAKTCSGCGLLLDAEWYRPARPGRPVTKRLCRKCTSTERGMRQPWDARPVETEGPRTKYEWTDADVAILDREDLSLNEMAQALGRTYAAVSTARRTFGARARWTPLPDPVEAWRITPRGT